ncbi:hypothetical protein [Clostridium sp.]|uniref:hypothetical protein n=1 Tax=Clostridium sp. TaxID=1506 RepID=UPI0026DC7333|nr:hypothetical protein [Clostridium sp.]MDO5040344.1 hypothetical protein [Clostridium sp.]
MDIKEKLIDLVVLNGDESEIKALEAKALNEDIFDIDNGREIVRKNNESLGNYIDRYSVEIMKNFSKEKYFKLKRLSEIYSSKGDSSEVVVTMTIEEKPKQNIFGKHKGKIAVGALAVAAGTTLFKFFSKKNTK